MMRLIDVVNSISHLQPDACICAKLPWTEHAECVVVEFENDRMPSSVEDEGYRYFLEIYLAQELLEVLKNKIKSVHDAVRLLIFYAQNDAYPDWVFD